MINWVLGGDMIRSIHNGDPEEFLSWTNRSPVFDCMVGCESFEVDLDTLTMIPGTPTRGDATGPAAPPVTDTRR